MSLARRITMMEESPTLAVDAKAKALKAAGEPVIGFGSGEPDFATPAHIAEAASKAALLPENHHYTATTGLPQLRKAIADTTAKTAGLPYTADNVVVTNGGKHSLYNIFMTLVDPGDEVIIPAPFWVTYPEQVKLAQGVPVIVSAGADTSFRVSVEMLEQARTPKTKVLVFCSPANPTGSVYPAAEVDAIARWAVENDIWIVTDEIYHKLVYGDAVFTSVPKNVPEIAERVVITSGVAKSYAMTGWRIGWSVGPEEFTKGVAKLQSQLTSNIGNISQLAAVEALTGPQDEIENMRQIFDSRRVLALKSLREIEGVDVVEPEGAFYVFPSFQGVLGRTINGHHITSTMQLAELLLDEVKVAIVPGEAFGAPGYLRLSYALGEDDLVEGIGRIADFINNG